MFKYSKIQVIFLSVVISICFYILIINMLKYLESNKKIKNKEIFNIQITTNNLISRQIPEAKLNNWILKIPKIKLEAKIKNGTSENILNEYIGHFEETEYIKGNIGLAAHNRGYNVNYFSKIKNLKKGDIIIYQKDEYIAKYKVNSKRIIRDDDWNHLKQNNKDIITLITCVENKPKLRLCIQAIKEEEK